MIETFLYLQPDSTVPENISSWTARMQVRSSTASYAVVYVTLTDGAGLVLGGTAGTIQVTLTGAQTAKFPANPNHPLRYDLFLFPNSGEPIMVARGKVFVTPAVTH